MAIVRCILSVNSLATTFLEKLFITCMYLLDPNGMQQRRRKRLKRRQYLSPGPNFVWHIDSYDKLKPYGIAINGCIDGLSRYIIWLEAATTNNDPKVIANYFMNAVREKGGCPKRVRLDLGTENTFLENMLKFLRRRHDDDFAGERSFLSGKSTFNQRIEWFWGLLRREMAQYLDLFSVLGNDTNNLYCGDYLDNNLIQFCFLEIIQANLDEVRGLWNTHVLQSKSIDENSGRRPLVMYTLPQLHHAEDHLCPVNDTDVTICAEETIPKLLTCVDETVFQLCMALMEEYRLSAPAIATKLMYKLPQLHHAENHLCPVENLLFPFMSIFGHCKSL